MRRKRRSAKEAMDALRDSRRKYEVSEAGKKRKKDWFKRNRDKVNAYRRKWEREKRERLSRAGARRTAI